LRPLSVTSYLSQSITRSPRMMILEASSGAFLDIAILRRRLTSSGVHGWKQISISARDVVMPSNDINGSITTTGISALAAAWTRLDGPPRPVPAAQMRAPSTLESRLSLLVSDVNFMNRREGSRAFKDATKRTDSGSAKPKRAIELN